MALSNKDIRALAEARKARRAVPQVDPADVVAGPTEPEVDVPATLPTRRETQPEETMQPPSGSVVVLEPNDPRTQPAPPDDLYVVTSIKLRRHQQRQLKAEKFHNDRDMQVVIEIALDEYFKKRYGRKGRGQNKH